MKENEIIQSIIGEAIKSYGFYLLGCDSDLEHDTITWTFMNKKEDLEQNITIRMKSRRELKLTFMTNAFGQRPIYAEDLTKDNKGRISGLWCYVYNDEQEFVKLIEYFKTVVFDYGFDALERISVPTTETRPTKEMDRYLYENHEELNKRYRVIFNIDESTTHEEIFRIVHDYISETQGQVFEQLKETLIGLAAIVGTEYANVSNGDWLWDSSKNICWVTKKEKYPTMMYPLSTVINLWREAAKHSFNILCSEYKSMSKS